ncbi:MAG: PilZ domain-containing protein [Sedimentisphaerales bacterium]|nr:PilZ domain-containing protein [Sedimentisphaerales bacterium]
MVCAFEQRHSQRSTVRWPVSVWHPVAGKFFNGKSINVSSDGALILLPLRAPVREGQQVEINFPRAETLANEKGCAARIKPARVVRVERTNAIATAAVKVALEFQPAPVPVEEFF